MRKIVLPENSLRANAYSSFVLGYFFNGALLWLIAKRTTGEMTNYRPILLFIICSDLLCLATNVLGVPVAITESGFNVWLALGPLRWLPQPYNFLLVASFFYLILFITCSLGAIFLYRYACICRNTMWGPRQFFAMLILPAVVAFGYIACALEGYAGSTADQEEANWRFFNSSPTCTKENFQENHYYMIAYFRRREKFKYGAVYLLFCFVANYLLVVFCAWRIYCQLTRQAEQHMSGEQYRALQLQLSVTLLLQASVPLALVFAPMMLFLLAAKAGIAAAGGNSSVYLTTSFAWEQVLKPMIAMWVLRTYRQGAIDSLCWLFSRLLGWRCLGGWRVAPATTTACKATTTGNLKQQQRQNMTISTAVNPQTAAESRMTMAAC